MDSISLEGAEGILKEESLIKLRRGTYLGKQLRIGP
jgi:hypothetical protein